MRQKFSVCNEERYLMIYLVLSVQASWISGILDYSEGVFDVGLDDLIFLLLLFYINEKYGLVDIVR